MKLLSSCEKERFSWAHETRKIEANCWLNWLRAVPKKNPSLRHATDEPKVLWFPELCLSSVLTSSSSSSSSSEMKKRKKPKKRENWFIICFHPPSAPLFSLSCVNSQRSLLYNFSINLMVMSGAGESQVGGSDLIFKMLSAMENHS